MPVIRGMSQAVKRNLIDHFGIKELIPKYGEAKAVDSTYAMCIFGIGVFTPEQ